MQTHFDHASCDLEAPAFDRTTCNRTFLHASAAACVSAYRGGLLFSFAEGCMCMLGVVNLREVTAREDSLKV